ncbi:LsmAD domain-containing protein [Sporodiniella umbellata]|nr:LsmAD domain-containing protein [Sporodiniella umbellata]
MHDRMLFLLGNMIGTVVDATVKDGSRFQGVFHGASTEGDLAIALNFAQKIFDPAAPSLQDKTNPNPIIHQLLIYSKDLVEVTVSDIDFSENTLEHSSFKTDTDISGKLETKERELHRWAPSEEDSALELADESLEASTGESHWDQFAVNEKLFGLKTDFNEEMYTTHLDRSAPGFKDREKHAIKVANEIQKTSTTNVHMLEERGISIDNSGMDEEDLYGAVARDKYVPPALRTQTQKQEFQKRSTIPAGKANTVPISKASIVPATKAKTIPSNNPNAESPKNSSSPIANLTASRRGSNEKIQQEKVKDIESPIRIESEVASTFKHFAMMEKTKLNAKKQALQKKEKDGRLAELMMFHQTFKLNVPVPADLLPLLSKKSANSSPSSAGSPSSDEQKKKAENPPSSPAAAPSPTPKVASKPSSPTPTEPKCLDASASPSSGSTFKLNAKASSFKPNPTAAAFVPGTSFSQQDDVGSFFGAKQLKRNSVSEPVSVKDTIKPSFLKKAHSPSSVGPTWPFGSKSYRVQFNQFSTYDEDVFTGYPSPGYGYGYPQYHYPQYVPGMPQMSVQQGGVPYMSPQFVSNVPISASMSPNGAPASVGYSPQMNNISPHGSPFPQGYPSPQRSHMVPQGMPPQMYQYQGTPIMRYQHDMMINNSGPQNMLQRPTMPEQMQYTTQEGPEVSPTN